MRWLWEDSLFRYLPLIEQGGARIELKTDSCQFIKSENAITITITGGTPEPGAIQNTSADSGANYIDGISKRAGRRIDCGAAEASVIRRRISSPASLPNSSVGRKIEAK